MTYIAEKVNFEYPRDIYQSSTQAYHLQATCVILHLLAHRELIQQFANIGLLTLWHHLVANMGFILVKKYYTIITFLLKIMLQTYKKWENNK